MAKTAVAAPAAGNEQALREELLAVKERASNLSGDVTRLSKALGESRNEVADLQEVVAENESLKADLADALKQVSALQSALKTADALKDDADKAVAAGKAIADNITLLAGL